MSFNPQIPQMAVATAQEASRTTNYSGHPHLCRMPRTAVYKQAETNTL